MDANAVLPVGRGELAAVTASLREVADRAAGDEEKPSMLRRQVTFLLAKPVTTRPRGSGLPTPNYATSGRREPGGVDTTLACCALSRDHRCAGR
jgi:hypothetical protein